LESEKGTDLVTLAIKSYENKINLDLFNSLSIDFRFINFRRILDKMITITLQLPCCFCCFEPFDLQACKKQRL